MWPNTHPSLKCPSFCGARLANTRAPHPRVHSFDGDAVVGDFGLSIKARAARSCNMGPSGDPARGLMRAPSVGDLLATTMCGTPSYMSPELVGGEAYGAPSDVWGLGVVLFELLTLRQPFESCSLGGLITAIQQGMLPPDSARALEEAKAPEPLKYLASTTSLLHPDPKLRTTPKEVLQLFPLPG